MKVYSFLLFTLLCFSPVYFQAQEAEPDVDYSDAFRLMDIWLEAQYQYDQLPGISVAIVKDQEVLYSKGFGLADTERQVPVEANTLYSICSISKLFTAIAVMQLRDAGKLSLEDKVEDLLPWFDLEQAYDDSGPITVRALLTHSSGLPRESAHPYWTGPDFPFPSQDAIREGLRTQETLYPASTYFQYSNLGLTLLGEIVAEVSNMPYDTYVQEKILTPLELEDTYTELPENMWGRQLAKGYGSRKRDGSRDLQKRFDAAGITPAAGFSSTVEDLGKFAAWQFRLLQDGGEDVLKVSSLREMQRVHWMDPDWKTSWGLGFSVYEMEGKTMVGHGGSCPGYRSTLMIDPQSHYAYVVMINASGENPGKYARALRSIMQKAEGSTYPANYGSVDLEAYRGLYNAQPWWGEEAILPWKGQLISVGLPNENPGENMTLLRHESDHTFRRVRKDDTLGEPWTFELGPDGKATHYVQHNNISRRLGSP